MHTSQTGELREGLPSRGDIWEILKDELQLPRQESMNGRCRQKFLFGRLLHTAVFSRHHDHSSSWSLQAKGWVIMVFYLLTSGYWIILFSFFKILHSPFNSLPITSLSVRSVSYQDPDHSMHIYIKDWIKLNRFQSFPPSALTVTPKPIWGAKKANLSSRRNA